MVNVASQCGYTSRDYKGMEELYNKYKDQGETRGQVVCFINHD